MPYISVVTHVSNKESSKEKAIEAAVEAAKAANPGYDVADVDIVSKPDNSYNVVTLLFM